MRTRARKAIATAPKFVNFRLLPRPGKLGAVLFALDDKGQIWERYPGRQWGVVAFPGTVEAKPWRTEGGV